MKDLSDKEKVTEIKTKTGVRRRVQLQFDPEKGLTKQQFKDECEIHNILARYDKLGLDLLELQSQNPGLYGDFSDVGSFQEAQNIIMAANAQFAALSASVRERFGNDPANFLRFMENPKENFEEMLKYGLIEKLPEKETDLADLNKTLQERLPLVDQNEKSSKKARSNE